MSTAAPSGPRTEFFQQLKRVCVPLSQLALRPKDSAVDAKEVLRLLESLVSLWVIQANNDAAILDDKLADYVFFPLSHLLRDRDRYPMRVIEVVIRLLRELVCHGWKAKASPQLFQQLMVFLAFVIGGVPGQPRREVPEETLIEGFQTLAALISVAAPSHIRGSADASAAAEPIPALGHSVTVMLDGVSDDVVAPVRLEAVECLRSVFVTIKDNTVLAQFFPGTVSAFAKALSPPHANAARRSVLLRCLDVLKLVLVAVLGDLRIRPLLKSLESPSDGNETAGEAQQSASPQGTLTPAWLKATTAQVRIALAAVLKLRAHESEEVQSALHRLCVNLLDECHSSLAGCQSILVETALMLEDDSASRSRLETSLQDLVSVYPELGESIKSALYTWITGLPRLMQSNDERVKQRAIKSILRGSKLAATLQIDSSTLDDALGDSLRDSIVTLVRGSKPPRIVDDIATDFTTGNELAKTSMELARYAPVLLDSESQKTTRQEINSLISSVGSAHQQVKLATTMLSQLRDSEGIDRIASFWLSFELLKATYEGNSALDDFFDLSSLRESRHQEDAFRELYDFSASVLSAHSDAAEEDWRLEAIALEVTAFAASRLKVDFRPELIDVLYPITTFLGSSVPQLRRHAIVTLNLLAASCGYESVSDLIVDNADYMVNSVSLRLNTFDISPASTKVLTMVVRLTGPRLIPFLDDVVAAIFAALDNYHGYPVFVESLFSVLSEVVTQGVKSDMLLLEGPSSKTIDHRKKRPQSQGIQGLLHVIDERNERAKRAHEEAAQPPSPHPKQPRGTKPNNPQPEEQNQAASLLDKLTNPPSSSTDPDPQPPSEEEEQPKPQTPTYTLLSRVLSLTQHHLTTPSPTLRKSLLDLVATAAAALAPDETAFLPLVHAVWPVAVARLRDPEPYVAVAACGALGELCRAAGDFVGGRLKVEWWDGGGNGKAGAGEKGLRGWVRRVKGEATVLGGRREGRGRGTVGGGKVGGGGGEGILIPVRGGGLDGEVTAEGRLVVGSSGALGGFAQAARVWEAVVGLLTAVVSYVKLEDDMFDDILGLVADVLPQYAELREALETVNADAVWLALYERGMIRGRAAPMAEGVEFRFATLDGRETVVV